MWRSIARFCSALFALSVLAFLVVQAGCGKSNKEVNSGALPESKAGPIIQQQAPEPQTTPQQTPPPDPAFFPGTKAGPVIPKPSTAPTSQKKNGPNNPYIYIGEPPVLPPTKSGKIFTPNQQ